MIRLPIVRTERSRETCRFATVTQSRAFLYAWEAMTAASETVASDA